MPLISVIIPAYNQARYLGLAIQSVLDQTRADFEVVVVDDGSTDDTAQVVERFTDPRVRYVFQSNRGLSAARNTGIRHSSGALLTFLDSDDLFLPSKLAVLADELERHPQAGLAAGQALPIDEHGRRVGKAFATPLPEDLTQLLLGNPLHVGSVLLRRAWQERAGFFDERLRSYEDWDMWLRLARLGCPMRYAAQPVSLYRFHSAQMTKDGNQMTAANFAVLEKIYGDPELPSGWARLRNRAYGNAHLRAAANSYLAQDVDAGKAHLAEAVALNPELGEGGFERLAEVFSAWLDLPKSYDPIAYLERIYANLPEHFGALRRRRRHDLGQAAMRMAWEAYRAGEHAAAREAAWRACRYRPAWLTNRGVLALLVKTSWKAFADLWARQPAAALPK